MNIRTDYQRHDPDRYLVWCRMLGGKDFVVCTCGSEHGASEQAEKQARIPNVEAVWLVDNSTARTMK